MTITIHLKILRNTALNTVTKLCSRLFHQGTNGQVRITERQYGFFLKIKVLPSVSTEAQAWPDNRKVAQSVKQV
jgi:hypothetical protein